MKTLIAISVALLLLIAAGHLGTTTVTEKTGQQCSSFEYYQNEWRDTYWLADWFQNRDDGKNFATCVGPSQYIRYHPRDLALLSFLGALTAGFIAYRNETMHTKKPKQKETK